MTLHISTRKITPSYSSSILPNSEGGIRHGTPEYAAAMERVKIQLASTRRKGSRDKALAIMKPIIEVEGKVVR